MECPGLLDMTQFNNTLEKYILSFFEPGHSIAYKIAYVPSEDSNQPAHQCNLFWTFAGHSVGLTRIQNIFRQTGETD